MDINITKAGLQILDDIDVPFESMESVLECVSDKELARFNEILDIIRNKYRDAANAV